MAGRAQPSELSNPLGCADLREPTTVLGLIELFARSLDEGRPLSDPLREKIGALLPGVSANLNYSSLREAIVELFSPRPGLYRVLSDMYELGVLEMLFPEFSDTKARVIRDFYHKYTVDEHTLIAIREVEKLTDEVSSDDGRFRKILDDSVSPALLTLALLFHDVGKGRPGRHTEQSSRLAAAALRRFRFPESQQEMILFLIRHHLAMAALVFRRDLEDPDVVDGFANLVSDTEQLRLLTLLTFADIKAVAPGTLNEWKKDLLWQLYVNTYRKLTLGYGEERIEEEDIGEKLIAGLEPDLDRQVFEKFLEGFPTRYLRAKPREIYEHFRLSTELSADCPVQTRIWKRRNFYELCVITPDRSRLFARIVGLLSYFDMNIFRGYGFSNRSQTVLDFFQFFDPQGRFRHSSERRRFQELLCDAVREEVSIETLIESKEKSVLYRREHAPFESSVYFNDDNRNRFSIVEIIAPDCLGLLYRISREIARLSCDIELALISTEGEKAVDVFYLTHQGTPLCKELKEELTERIIQATA
jgi:[protein-PII] uridylyltransferase